MSNTCTHKQSCGFPRKILFGYIFSIYWEGNWSSVRISDFAKTLDFVRGNQRTVCESKVYDPSVYATSPTNDTLLPKLKAKFCLLGAGNEKRSALCSEPGCY